MVVLSLSRARIFFKYRPTANVLWAVAGVIFVVSVALLTTGNVLAAHQSAHWWSAVVYADLGGLGSFIAAVVAVVALRISGPPTASSSNNQSDQKGINEHEKEFLSHLMDHMASKELLPQQVAQINEIARTLVESKREVNITNIYPSIAPAEGASTEGVVSIESLPDPSA
jgi:hypothetical protein